MIRKLCSPQSDEQFKSVPSINTNQPRLPFCFQPGVCVRRGRPDLRPRPLARHRVPLRRPRPQNQARSQTRAPRLPGREGRPGRRVDAVSRRWTVYVLQVRRDLWFLEFRSDFNIQWYLKVYYWLKFWVGINENGLRLELF